MTMAFNGWMQPLQTLLPGAQFYPAWETLPHEDVLPHADTIADRLKVLTQDMKRALLIGDLSEFGELLHLAWESKRHSPSAEQATMNFQIDVTSTVPAAPPRPAQAH